MGITVRSDGSSDLPEPDETFSFVLSDAVDGTRLEPQGVGTILE